MFRVSTPHTTFLSPRWCIVPPPCVSTNNSPFTGSDPSSIESLSATDALISAKDQVLCEYCCSPVALSLWRRVCTVDTGQTRAALTATHVTLDENEAVRKEAIT